MLHQLAGTKRVVLYSPDQAAALRPAAVPFSLDEHGTIFSTLPFPQPGGVVSSACPHVHGDISLPSTVRCRCLFAR